MEGEEEVSIKELASNLTTYKEQLQQVWWMMMTVNDHAIAYCLD